MIYLGGGIVAYLLLATVGHNATVAVRAAGHADPVVLRRRVRDRPGVPADLFGTFQVGAIHGRLLTAWSAAGVAGPLIVNGFLDAKGTPGKLTVDAYRPALYTMVGHAGRRLHRQPADPAGRRPASGSRSAADGRPDRPAPTEREKV